jgi:hypothetical protein
LRGKTRVRQGQVFKMLLVKIFIHSCV